MVDGIVCYARSLGKASDRHVFCICLFRLNKYSKLKLIGASHGLNTSNRADTATGRLNSALELLPRMGLWAKWSCWSIARRAAGPTDCRCRAVGLPSAGGSPVTSQNKEAPCTTCTGLFCLSLVSSPRQETEFWKHRRPFCLTLRRAPRRCRPGLELPFPSPPSRFPTPGDCCARSRN